MTGQQLWTAQQVAEWAQVPDSQIYRLTRDGVLPAIRLGRYYRYRLDDVIQALGRGEQAPQGRRAA